MLQTKPSVRGPVATANVASFMTLTSKLIERHPHAPGIGVFYGPSGFGKTYASIFGQNRSGALRIEVGESWTRKTLLKAVLAEAGQVARGSISDMAEAAIRVLGDDPYRPLIIDEADRMLDGSHRMIELVRDLHDKSTAPIILIGEEQLPSKIQPNERVHNRVLDWVAAQASDLEDAQALAASICGSVEVADDLLSAIVERSEGRARRIVVNLVRAEEIARNLGQARIDLTTWGETEFFESRPPRARSFASIRRGR
ncbi:MAG: hypothetical protein B7Y12_01995 [Rhizobiales bacterium 24-66-13]|nr:MAG: hypothetical protein B7Z41_03850 [Rhizobiales bacterium 12-66-7]OYY88793.1 MAG: hypothetical protein B7Y61_01025 [Rhizobiales bacterium 35-66-30]OYZ82788.1 MAG: hypothetical protein B7Y12_01995 [Rhizobiales bacterium 24-66-13]OZB11871.1 MAG: hypothetical protein B7X67_01975 [Rhizobiales bacterium 39-66-18]